MGEQFVTYEIALKLKELGFDEEVIATFDTDENNELKIFAFSVPDKGIFEIGFNKGWCIKAPLWQQAIKFINDKLHSKFGNQYKILFDGNVNSKTKNEILKHLELIK